MKYSKIYQHTDGKHYVLLNSTKYRTTYASETKAEAKKVALAMSADYYLKKAVEALDALGDEELGKLFEKHEELRQVWWRVGELKDKIERSVDAMPSTDETDPCYWC